MQPADLDLIYEEGPVWVVNKPGGVLTQAPPGIDSIAVRARRLLRERKLANPAMAEYLGVPHRLDRPASGALLLATSRRAAQRLTQQFEAREVQKTYWALLAGELRDDEGEWRDFLRKIPDQAQAEIVSPDHPEAREAILRYRLLARPRPGVSLVAIELLTGRMHQIRVQAASRGHAVLGDAQYGSTLAFGPPTADPRDRWIALHARQVAFSHPQTRTPVAVTAPLPACWTDYGAGESAKVAVL